MADDAFAQVSAQLREEIGTGAHLPGTKKAIATSIAKTYPDLRDVIEYAEEIADEVVGDMVKDITEETREVIRRLTTRALTQGWDDDTLADRIAEKVGLDQRGALAVENFREGQIKAGVPKGIARKNSRAYAKRLRRARGDRIARTELQRVLNIAQRELWKQQQQDGELSPYAVRVTRLHKDERLCDPCRRENGRRRSLSRTPHQGPPFHPHCRCYEELEDQGVVKTDPALVYVVAGMDTASVQGTAGVQEGRDMDKVEKGSRGRLDWSPKKNWVENAGGLPKYIEDIAVALVTRRGMTRSKAIAVAVSRVKMWAAGGEDVNADTRAKAAKAVAQWEALKAKNKMKDVRKQWIDEGEDPDGN